MDGDSFDRLSVGVHRLRERVTRRGALGVLLGGSVAAAIGVTTDDTDAKRRRRKNKCRGFGGRCSSSRDCCDGRCRNGFCFPDGGGGGGGGNRCNGVRCPSGWRCCRFQGFDRCLPDDHAACIGSGECPFGWDRCGFNGPIRTCCTRDQHCCENDFGNLICLSDMFDCDDFFGRSSNVEGASAESSVEGATSEPIPVTEIDPAEFD